MARVVVCCTTYYECGSNADGTKMICAETVCEEYEVPDEPPGGDNLARVYDYPASVFADVAKKTSLVVAKSQRARAKKLRAKTVRVRRASRGGRKRLG